MFKKLKIKYKLLCINFFSILVVLLVSNIIRTYEIAKINEGYLTQRIERQGKLVANNITAAVMFNDWDETKVILNTLAGDTAIISAKVITDSKQKGVKFHNQNILDELRWHQNFFYRPRVATEVIPVFNGFRKIGDIEIEYHNKELRDAITENLLSAAKTLFLALTLGMILSLRMQSLVTRPIRKLSNVALRVTKSKNYSLRGEYFYPDEIGGLTKDFNRMLEIIEKRDQHLEQKVQERTQLLRNNYEKLKKETQKREKTEEENREIQQRFKQAFINAPIGMALIASDGTILQSNAVLKSLLELNNKTNLSNVNLIDYFCNQDLDHRFKKLTTDRTLKFEKEVKHISSTHKILHFIISFSSVCNNKNQFQYAIAQIQDITQLKSLSEKLRFQATHDSLTGLPNRRVLKEQLSQLLKTREPNSTHTLCILDLDQFKVVNDTCGHAAGDAMLRQLAGLIRSKVSDNDLIVRLGGDEFALLLRDCNADQAKTKTEAIRQAVEQWEFIWKAQSFRAGVSIGAVTIDNNCNDHSLLMQQADAACFVAKDMGRNRVYILKSNQDRQIGQHRGEMRWVQRIHEAIEKDLFLLVGQPVPHLQEEKKNSRCEILIRLRDTENKDNVIPPGAFLPAAERFGISPKIDRWVVSKLIAMLQSNEHLIDMYSSYWVNLSGHSLGEPSFVSFLEEAIGHSGLPRGLINFEITETAVMRNIEECHKAMSRLKLLGCAFALDDFGSGVSSFGYLKNLPVDYLKIDGMFVRDILKDEIDLIFVKSIIDIAKVMGLKTIAEFVETEAVREKLVEMGADFGQGFFLGRPQPLLATS